LGAADIVPKNCDTHHLGTIDLQGLPAKTAMMFDKDNLLHIFSCDVDTFTTSIWMVPDFTMDGQAP
jgi:hypothetical protein